MKPQTFAIKAENKKLLEAIWDELMGLGYIDESSHKWEAISQNNKNPKSYEEFLELTHNSTCEVIDKIFNLPQQYQEALDFAKEQLALWKSKEKILYFGKVRFTIEKDFAWVGYDINTNKFGKATKEDISKFIDHIKYSPRICGYELNIHVGDQYCPLDAIRNLPNPKFSLGIGCEKGTLSELEAILAAFE